MKQFFFKAIVFICLIIVGQSFIAVIFGLSTPSSLQSLAEYKQRNTSIIYFGDSTVHTINKKDKIQTPLYKMVGDRLYPFSLGTIIHDSYQPDIELSFCQEIVREGYHPKLLIVPINLRSFSPEWDLRPGFQFNIEHLYLSYIHTPLAIFLPFIQNFEIPEIDAANERAYQNALVYNGDTIVGKAPEFEDTSKLSSYGAQNARLAVFFYMASLHPTHRKVQSLVQIADLFKNSDTKVLFYITPIDVEAGKHYVGNEFPKRVEENAKMLVSLLSKKAPVLNLATALHTSDFSWRDEGWYMNEHMLESGREKVAAAVAKKAKELLNQ